jgi:hypothetical protein
MSAPLLILVGIYTVATEARKYAIFEGAHNDGSCPRMK